MEALVMGRRSARTSRQSQSGLHTMCSLSGRRIGWLHPRYLAHLHCVRGSPAPGIRRVSVDAKGSEVLETADSDW